MTTNFQLEDYVKKHKHRLGTNQHFLGVFPSDELPDAVGKNQCLIINYSPNDKTGTHWVAMRNLNSNKPAEYFDSYGLAPDQADPLLRLKTHMRNYIVEHSSSPYIYNSIDLQSWKEGEDECGEWALLFIMEGLPNVNNKVWAKFLYQRDKQLRDRMVKKYIGIRK